MMSGWKKSMIYGTLLRVALGVGVLISLLISSVSNPALAGQATELERAAKKDGRLRIVVFPSIRPAAEAFRALFNTLDIGALIVWLIQRPLSKRLGAG